MIHFMDVLAYPKKKIRILLVFFISYLSWILYVTYQLLSQSEEVSDLYIMYDKLTYQMMIFMVPFLIGWLWIDLFHPHDRVFIAFSYPRYLWDIKFFYVSVMSILYILFFTLSWMIIPRVWIPNLILNLRHIDLIHVFLDIIMLSLCSQILLTEKTKTLSLIFPLFYVIFGLVMQDQPSLYVYYVLPLYQKEIITYEVAMTYKLWYIGLGFILIRYFFGKTARNG